MIRFCAVIQPGIFQLDKIADFAFGADVGAGAHVGAVEDLRRGGAGHGHTDAHIQVGPDRQDVKRGVVKRTAEAQHALLDVELLAIGLVGAAHDAHFALQARQVSGVVYLMRV